jgi:hypothetical protein
MIILGANRDTAGGTDLEKDTVEEVGNLGCSGREDDPGYEWR